MHNRVSAQRGAIGVFKDRSYLPAKRLRLRPSRSLVPADKCCTGTARPTMSRVCLAFLTNPTSRSLHLGQSTPPDPSKSVRLDAQSHSLLPGAATGRGRAWPLPFDAMGGGGGGRHYRASPRAFPDVPVCRLAALA